MKRPVRVLYVSGGSLDYGGIATAMLNYAGQIGRDQVHIDFFVHGLARGPREAEAEALGARVIHAPYKLPHYFANRKALLRAFRDGGYDIVHAHMDGMNGYVLGLAGQAGIPVRISHCHNTQFLTNNPLRVRMHRHMANRIGRVATHLFACSEAAGRFLYGDAAVEAGKLTIVPNAIELARYRFNAERRAAVRAELGVADRFVIGHIGRFDYQKNQEFLLPVLAELRKQRPEACLVLVGDGESRAALMEQIARLGLTKHVALAGFYEDIPAMLAAFDRFVLPSRFEGLGIVLIEAQACGLPCIASDRVPGETRVLECAYLGLDDASAWAAALADAVPVPNAARAVPLEPFELAGYDIKTEAKRLERMYLGYVK